MKFKTLLKRTILLSAAVSLMAFGLAGCGNSAAEETTEKTKEEVTGEAERMQKKIQQIRLN